MNLPTPRPNPLRMAAEAQHAKGSKPAFRPAEAMLHELQVHQIELEMQNEELRQAHVKLDTERARYFDLYDLAPVGYLTVSEAGLVLQANFTVCTLLGVNRVALLKQAFSHFMLPDDTDIFYLLRKRILSSHEPQYCELRMVNPLKQQVWVHLAISGTRDELGEPVFRIALSDISERKQAEAALRESEAFGLAILNSVTSEIAVLDRQGVILAVNETWNRFSIENGVEPGKPAPHTQVGANYLSVCQRSSASDSFEAANTRQGIEAVLAGRLPVFNLEYPCHSPEEQRWFSMSVTPLGPDRRGVVITHANITERMLAEEDLRIAAAAFECQEGFAVMDAHFKILRANQAFTQITGYSTEEAKGKTRKLLRSDRHPASFYDAFWSDDQACEALLTEMWMRRKNGEDFLAQVAKTAVRNAQGQVAQYVVNFTDITQLHLQEEKRLQNEALHRNALVREVHHRIKNNLQGITGLLSQFAKIHPETAEPITQAISQVQGISVIHGLQGSSNTSSVRLCELTQAIATEAGVLWQTPVAVAIAPDCQVHFVAEKEAVPIALILNELLLNALKHGGKADGHINITLRQNRQTESVDICITNAGQLIATEAPPSDRNIRHSGLKLITALMPPHGASISRHQDGRNVSTLLALCAPVIFIETAGSL